MTILISPEFDIILDENYKLIGEARRDLAFLDLGPIERKIEEVEILGKELVKSLDPTTAPLISSRSRREGVYRAAGIVNNMVVGFIIGLILFTLVILMIVASSDTAFFKTIFGG